MYILGIHNAMDSGICLMRDGQILEAVNEERFTRVKLQGGFPDRSLAYVLEKYGLDLGDIDHIAYGWYGKTVDYPQMIEAVTKRVSTAVARDHRAVPIFHRQVEHEVRSEERHRGAFCAAIEERGAADKVAFLDHHLSHAWSAFACSPFERALVFTFDGRGDLRSSTVCEASVDRGLRELDSHLSYDSLGYLYGQVTHFLGFKCHRHEGKVLGLAAHGDAERTLPLFERIIGWEDGRFVANIGLYEPYYTSIGEELGALYGQHSREDLAAGLQLHCERLILRYIRHWIEKRDVDGPVDICLAGGVAANVRINQAIGELDGVGRVFVFPNMGDGGLPLGAACHLNFDLTGNAKVPFETAYLGPEYDSDAVAGTLGSYGDRIEFERVTDGVGRVVDDLTRKAVVGYFDGRLEYGPRALGARSILVHGTDPTIQDWLNGRLRRTEFMPFAPVTPVDYAAECYSGWREDDPCASFMTRTYDCTASFRELHRAAVHVDGTARPQVIRPEHNRNYYDVVKAYCDETGERCLINTSFNAHEEPIVCSPEDAVQGLIADCVDVLHMGGYRVVKR